MTTSEIRKFVVENEEEILELIQEDDNQGMCVNCGAISDCVEPDACNYECEECGEHEVFGASELLMYF